VVQSSKCQLTINKRPVTRPQNTGAGIQRTQKGRIAAESLNYCPWNSCKNRGASPHNPATTGRFLFRGWGNTHRSLLERGLDPRENIDVAFGRNPDGDSDNRRHKKGTETSVSQPATTSFVGGTFQPGRDRRPPMGATWGRKTLCVLRSLRPWRLRRVYPQDLE
jgi:hypothetical protein